MTKDYEEIKIEVTEELKKIIEARARHLHLSVSDDTRLTLGLRPLYDEGPPQKGESSW